MRSDVDKSKEVFSKVKVFDREKVIAKGKESKVNIENNSNTDQKQQEHIEVSHSNQDPLNIPKVIRFKRKKSTIPKVYNRKNGLKMAS